MSIGQSAGRRRRMHLAAFCAQPGNHVAGWRHPGADTEAILDPSFYQTMARVAERGLFDLVFIADTLAVLDHRTGALPSTLGHIVPFRAEPLTALTLMAAATEHIGLAGTVSTSYNEPFNVARRFAFLDHISRGRIGWNVVTTASEPEARNFAAGANIPHAERYARAAEFVDVVRKLWDSWEDGAVVADRARGLYALAGKVRPIDHEGQFFSVRGPLNVPRPPQGHPVIFQAGTSPAGQDLAGRTADVVFFAAQTQAEATTATAGIIEAATRHGRSRDDLRFLPGVLVFAGRTRDEALEKQARLSELLNPTVGAAILAELLDIDFSSHPLDGPFPTIDVEAVTGIKSRYVLLKAMAERDGLTLRQVMQRVASGAGHRIVIGDPEEIADELEAWFVDGTVDGYSLQFPYLPGALEDFVELVVPVLQRRGLTRLAYDGRTLRDHLGLRRPAGRVG